MDVREKMVKQAISHFEYGVSHDIFSEPVTTYAKLAIEALEKEKESCVTAQEWISVKDRLPEEDGTYLTALNHHFGAHQGVSIRKFAKDGETVDEYGLAGQKYVWYFYDSEYGYVPTDSVTHWMPIPQPPEVGRMDE